MVIMCLKMTLPSGDAFMEGDRAFQDLSPTIKLALGSLRASAKLLAHTAPSDNGHFPGIGCITIVAAQIAPPYGNFENKKI